MRNKTLLIPAKADSERDKIAEAWQQQGGQVLRLDKFWNPPQRLIQQPIAIYGPDLFGRLLAQLLKVQLISPADEFLTHIAHNWTKREIQLLPALQLDPKDFPCFVKSVIPKQIQSKVYTSLNEFEQTNPDFVGNDKLFKSPVIPIEAEVRAFVLNWKLSTAAFYEGSGDLEAAIQFAQSFLETYVSGDRYHSLPTFVLDLGYNSDLGWFVLEFNATWGAGLNGCEPQKVISCIDQATQPFGFDLPF